jgi:hypothetical protein
MLDRSRHGLLLQWAEGFVAPVLSDDISKRFHADLPFNSIEVA